MTTPKRPLLAPDKVKIYLALVPYLAERGQVSVADAAADFDVTPDAMRRMVEKLTVMGLPGEDGYWQLDQDLFNINWDLLDAEDIIELTNTVALRRAPRLTAREAAALLSGLRLVQSLPGIDDDGAVSALISKLSLGSSTSPADVIVAPAAADVVRATVADGIRAGKAISFTYQAPDAEATTRMVDPVKVHVTSGEWYLQGWCHLRHAMRTFHLARVSDVSVTDEPITHGADSVPELFDLSDEDQIGTIRFPADVASLLGEFLTHADQETVGRITVAHLRISDPRTLKRLAARRGGQVEVLAPTTARTTAHEWARRALEQYTDITAT